MTPAYDERSRPRDWAGRARWERLGEALRTRDFVLAQRIVDEMRHVVEHRKQQERECVDDRS